ncbi:MAG TPA: PD-(D/E)XK nuclease family protein [Usitatibacter sp.]|nr:PD-(D/E)XK nuclease family protein [Usitatibacter sp.]
MDRGTLLARLAGGGEIPLTVVTSSRRLAQALARGFDAAQAGAGAPAWATADILPFGAWIERFWQDALYSDVGGGLPLLLGAAAEQAVWEDCIHASHRDVLLSIPAAATEAMEAWSLAHEWALAPRLSAAAQHDDARAFVEWSGRYQRLTGERGQTDRARLPDLVASLLDHESLRKPGEVVLAGFDLLTPQQAQFLRRLQAQGVAIALLEAEPREGHCVRVSFAKGRDEIEMAARWARARLESAPSARIGVVIPELARERARVERVFARTLDPARLPGDPRALPFNLSLGLPLAEWPIVRDALGFLRLAGRELAFEEASALLRSPFIAGAETEHAARAALDAALRRRSPARVTIDAVVRLIHGRSMPSAPLLCTLLERLAAFRRTDLFERRRPAAWARAMEAALRRAGFPGERTLDSAEYQAWTAWHEALGELSALERVTGSMGYTEACERLARIAGATLFQPQTPDVPIQVMGLLESVGHDFDALWIAGMADDAWPKPPRANAFLPLALQHAAGIPHADARASLDLDERITQGWRRAADEVVFSHVRMRDDCELAASPLVADIAESDVGVLAVAPALAPREAIRGRATLQRLADGVAPPVDAAQRSGGTRLFKDQAACPFRAFARHRLRSEPLERPTPGLDDAARGTLMHEMMAHVWRSLEDKARLDALGAAQLDELLAACADAAIEACRRIDPATLTGRFEALERERLIGTAREWLAIERAREPFSVVAIEHKRAMTFGGITVNVKLDRMDALERGGRAVIDYKTGVAAVGSWLGPRPDEPQVPMYTLGSGEDVRAVAFARLKRGEMGFAGFGMEPGLLPKVDVVQKNRSRGADEYADWAQLVAGWRDKLEALGQEFARGEARVDPKAPNACDQCDQHAFCRIAARRDADG